MAENEASRLCYDAQIDLIDWNFSWFFGYHRLGPERRWLTVANRVPDGYGFTKEQWELRFHSVSKLKAYRLGMSDAGYNWALDAQRIPRELRNQTLY